jgi:hypothetical protein
MLGDGGWSVVFVLNIPAMLLAKSIFVVLRHEFKFGELTEDKFIGQVLVMSMAVCIVVAVTMSFPWVCSL